MATKKKNDGFFDDLFEKGEKKAKRTAKSKAKRLHTATKVIAVLCLVVGIALGAVICLSMFKNDDFVLKGQKQFSLNVGDEAMVYTEEGVEAICFGKDVSGTLKVVASAGIVCNADGTYTIPTDKEGVYTLTYTVDCYKFGEAREGGPIKRIRTFTVDAAVQDSIGEGLVEEGGSSGT